MVFLNDHTWNPRAIAAEPFKQIGKELDALGFVRVGLAGAEIADPNTVLAAYAEPDRSWLAKNLDAPSVVFRSPDGDVFAEYSLWHGDQPAIHFRSRLADGSLCATLRAIERMPVTIHPAWLGESGERRQMRGHQPKWGRSILRVDTLKVAELWARHRAHLADFSAQRSSAFGSHHTIAEYIQLASAGLEHDGRCRFSVGLPMIAMMIGIGVVLIGSVWALNGLIPRGALAVWLVLWALFFTTLGPRMLYRYARSLEPWFAPKFLP